MATSTIVVSILYQLVIVVVPSSPAEEYRADPKNHPLAKRSTCPVSYASNVSQDGRLACLSTKGYQGPCFNI
nr:hypothetical protein CFP56_04829 [Quercus suber]